MSTLPKVKKMVEYCLNNFPETRDSDIELTIRIWNEFFPSRIIVGQSGAQAIRLKDLFDLPREDHVKRIRAKIQNEEGRFLPTTLKIAMQRGIEEVKWKEFMGYPSAPNPYPEN